MFKTPTGRFFLCFAYEKWRLLSAIKIRVLAGKENSILNARVIDTNSYTCYT